MALIKSISGIRGTIGGRPGEGLSPIDVVKFASAYAAYIKKLVGKEKLTIVVGRDARISGQMVDALVSGALTGMGADVINIGLATTPTTEMAVTWKNADGGIIITASHNPKNWNALKLLNNKGEFLNAEDGKEILTIAENEEFNYPEVDDIGQIMFEENALEYHINEILKLPYVNVEAIKAKKFKVVIDCVNSVGGITLPVLLKKLGVETTCLYCEPNGEFPHNPEPLPEHLTDISEEVKKQGADLGFVVDPDVDRLAIVNEDGSMFGEEYTLVAVADYILKQKKGNTVSNLSSSRALRDVTLALGGKYEAAAVGEVNVVAKMREIDAVIGGEGNGGVILPDLHYGRDSLVGVALFLSLLASEDKKCTELRGSYPEYIISKNKIQLTPDIDVDGLLSKIEAYYNEKKAEISTIDGVKIDFAEGWVHLRKSNTEPIIRIYAEGKSLDDANSFADEIKALVDDILNKK